MTVTSKMLEIPQVQSILLPNQVRKLKNNSSHNKISFTWHVTNPDHVQVKELFFIFILN